MTIAEAVQYTGKSEKTIRNYIRDGKLSSQKIDGKYQIEKEDLEKVFGTGNADGNLPETFLVLKEQLLEKDQQLAKQGEQIDHLTQLLAISQKSIQQLTGQNQILLEDTRKRASWWKRLFGRNNESLSPEHASSN